MKQKYVIDTTSLISYFSKVFEKKSAISDNALSLIDKAFCDNSILLFFPSIVFLEIFSKHFVTEEKARMIKYEVLEVIKNRHNMSIEPIDIEVLTFLAKIDDIEPDHNFDNHDKQVFATAMKFNCPLITSDENLMRYNKRKKFIPKIIS